MDVTMEESSGKETQSNTSENNEKQDALTTTTIKINEHEINNEMTLNNSHKEEGMSIEEQQISNCKTLKRCLSVPNIGRGGIGQCGSSMTLRSAAAASALKRAIQAQHEAAMAGNANEPTTQQETPKKCSYPTLDLIPNHNNNNQHHHHQHHHNHIHIAIPRSNPSSREVSPAPMFNIFAPRARRYSASFSPSGGIVGAASTTANNAPLYLTPRVSQLRKEECADVNTREVNHEREVHSAIQMSQSWEDLTLVAENWSCKSDELSNPLQVALPAAVNSCSSPSPTNNRPVNMRLPYGLSPSPTRRTFATRRSMSPIAMRPSQLGPVKRKFDLDDQNTGHTNWSVYSPPPLKKIFTESRGSSPIGQSPSSVCPSPDSGTYEGRITPKLSKLCTTNTNAMISNIGNNSNCSSPSSNSSLSNNLNLGLIAKSNYATSSSTSSSSSTSTSTSGVSSNEAMCTMEGPMDDGMSISDSAVTTSSSAGSTPAPVVGDIQDDGTMMDDTKSETSSIGGCSSVSIESSSSNTFLNRFNIDSELGSMTSGLVPKHFFINKLHGISGAKKYIVNHDHSDSNLSVSSTTTTMSGTNDLLENAVPPTIIVNNKM